MIVASLKEGRMGVVALKPLFFKLLTLHKRINVICIFVLLKKQISMTRINVGIPPSELTTKHLIAEHREIVRIPNCVAKGKFNLKDQPSIFTLGKGHVKFFYTRLAYLKKRYEDIYKDCLQRGYNVTYYGNAWDNVPNNFMNDYEPTAKDIEIIKQRINERLTNKTISDATI